MSYDLYLKHAAGVSEQRTSPDTSRTTRTTLSILARRGTRTKTRMCTSASTWATSSSLGKTPAYGWAPTA